MAPGLRYVNSEVTRGFFFIARLLHSLGGGYFTLKSAMQQGCK